jgi:hypothetical protein
MTTPFPFVAAQTLTAQQLNDITNLPINDQTASYTAVVGDAGKRIVMNVATANTVTINDSIFTTGDTIFIANKAAGITTVTAGAGVTINTSGSLALAQHGGGTLVALSASVFTFFSGGALNALNLEFLVVAGGGSGGGNTGGGGGAGGFLEAESLIPRTTASYTVTIGAGGAGVFNNDGNPGTASTFRFTTASGGGKGVRTGAGGAGGSGGGGVTAGGTGTAGQGNAGGSGVSNYQGGGGGKGGVGTNGAGTTGGSGGAAQTNSYTGSAISYSGGGGAGTFGGTAGTGGTNAGNGTNNDTNGGNGVANRGGGGGGGGSTAVGSTGGNGGSGQVVVRYLTSDSGGMTITATGATSGTPTVSGLYSYFQYTSTGTLAVA